MYTRFRSKEGNIPTQYCPLDLYSNDEARIRKAIRDLWNGWVQSNDTLNNMRIFVSGKMIRPSEVRILFTDILIHIHFWQSHPCLAEFLSTRTDVHEAFATALLPLLQTPVLRIISDLQRSLDALDIEGIAKLHAMASPNANLAAIRKNPSLQEFQDFIASYHTVYRALDHSQLFPENLDTYLVAYLLSATFKDCSMIFRIRRSDVSRNSSVDSPHAISVIDLDLKGVDRFERWADLDRQIVESYRNKAYRKFCVE